MERDTFDKYYKKARVVPAFVFINSEGYEVYRFYGYSNYSDFGERYNVGLRYYNVEWF